MEKHLAQYPNTVCYRSLKHFFTEYVKTQSTAKHFMTPCRGPQTLHYINLMYLIITEYISTQSTAKPGNVRYWGSNQRSTLLETFRAALDMFSNTFFLVTNIKQNLLKSKYNCVTLLILDNFNLK